MIDDERNIAKELDRLPALGIYFGPTSQNGNRTEAPEVLRNRCTQSGLMHMIDKERSSDARNSWPTRSNFTWGPDALEVRTSARDGMTSTLLLGDQKSEMMGLS
jgi:hypothetical protein